MIFQNKYAHFIYLHRILHRIRVLGIQLLQLNQ